MSEFQVMCDECEGTGYSCYLTHQSCEDGCQCNFCSGGFRAINEKEKAEIALEMVRLNAKETFHEPCFTHEEYKAKNELVEWLHEKAKVSNE